MEIEKVKKGSFSGPFFIIRRVMAIYNFKKDAKVYVYPTINVERGLTLSETRQSKSQIDADGAFDSTPRGQKVFMAGEVILPKPSDFVNTYECLFEHGGNDTGTWIGKAEISGINTFLFRTGNGAAGTTGSSTDRIYKTIPIADIPEFDGKIHTVSWELNQSAGTAKMWIDSRLILSEETTDASSYTGWSSGNPGGWLKGYSTIAGQTTGSFGESISKNEWSGAAGSDLRIYTNQSTSYPNDVKLLDVTEEISFSQTFTDETFTKRTVHELHKLHEASNIKKANPANFELTIPGLDQNDLNIMLDLLVDFDESGHNLNTFDLFVVGNNSTFRLKNCVITNGTFIIEKLENLKLTIAGEATKLVHGVTFPGLVGTRSTNRHFQKLDYLEVKVGDSGSPVTLSEGIYRITVELQNEVKWTPHATLNDALDVINSDSTMYPSNFTLEKRILSGSIGQYIISSFKDNVQEWKTEQDIIIKASNKSDFSKGFQFNLQNCTFTNRTTIDDVFTQSYDWKMNDNPADLGSKITFN